MKAFYLSSAILVLAGSSCVLAQEIPKPAKIQNYVQPSPYKYGAWRSTVLGSGGYLQQVVASPTNPKRYYMTSDVGGLFRSDDAGDTWQMLHGNLPAREGNYQVRGLIVDPRDDKKVVIATGSPYGASEGIYVSADAGQTWKQTLSNVRFVGNGPTRWTGSVLTRSPQNPDVLWCAGAGDGVYKSTDNGLTWKESGAKELYPTDLLVDRTNPNRLWLSTGGGKLKGKEYTASFHRSDDGGATWTKIEGPTPAEIVQDPKAPQYLYGIFQNAYIRRSEDGGLTWKDWAEGLLIEAPDLAKGKPAISKSTYRAITAGPDFILLCNTRDSDFFKLPSGGSKWEPVVREKKEAGDWYRAGNGWYFGAAAGSLTVAPSNPNHWFMTDYFALWQTKDAGKNWRLTIDGVEMTVVHNLLQDPADPAVVHIGVADVGAFTTTDGGQRLIKGNVPNEGKDKDGGGNMKCFDMSPKDPNRLYAVGNRSHESSWGADHVFVSTDRGKTWKRTPMTGLPNMKTQRCTTIVADLNDPNTVYLTMSGTIRENWGGVYKSTDGAQTWTHLSEGLPAGKYYFPSDIWAHGRQLAASADGSLVALSQQNNIAYRFDPATKTWVNAGLRPKGGGKFWSVVADRLKPGRYFIGSQNDGIYRSDDSGATWKKVYAKGAPVVAVDSAVAGRVAAGTADGVILSTDGGDTWTELDKGLPNRVDNIPAFAGERLLVGTSGSGVFWIPLSAVGEKPVLAKVLPSRE